MKRSCKNYQELLIAEPKSKLTRNIKYSPGKASLFDIISIPCNWLYFHQVHCQICAFVTQFQVSCNVSRNGNTLVIYCFSILTQRDNCEIWWDFWSTHLHVYLLLKPPRPYQNMVWKYQIWKNVVSVSQHHLINLLKRWSTLRKIEILWQKANQIVIHDLG